MSTGDWAASYPDARKTNSNETEGRSFFHHTGLKVWRKVNKKGETSEEYYRLIEGTSISLFFVYINFF